MNAKHRILLLLDNKKNRDLLAEWLSVHYQVILPDAEQTIQRSFDLCIIDGQTLDRQWKEVRARKEAEQPLFLPFALLTSRRDVEMVTRHLWQTTDELLLTPIEKVELQARMEILLRTRRLSLELKLRNEDLESFVHAMTHDLRAPIRAITGFSEALLEDESAQLSTRGQRYLARMRTASQEMMELIDSLLNFSRIGREEVQLQAVDVQLILESCLRNLEQEIQASNVQVIIEGKLPEVQANPTLLKMALTNLLSNAFKFVAEGVQPVVTISAAVMQGRCRMQIQDNGIGIGLENQQRLFTPFMRLHGIEEYAGIGLGLATVHKAVQIMGGRVGMQSLPAGGSIFWIELEM